MTKAIRVHVHGGPEVMCFEEIKLPPPAPGEIRIRHTAIGVNFSDINVRAPMIWSWRWSAWRSWRERICVRWS